MFLEQKVEGNSTAVQVAHDINIEKLSVQAAPFPTANQLNDISDFFLDNHRPLLREEAAAVFAEHVHEFIDIIKCEIKNTGTDILPTILTDPDKNSIFNDALNMCGRKGKEIDLDLLSKLIVKRMSSVDTDVLTLTTENAIKLVPILTKEQINFLSINQYLDHVHHLAFTDIQQLENEVTEIYSLVHNSFTLSESNKTYLSSVGALTVNRVANNSQVPTLMSKHYSFFPANPVDQAKQCPNLHKMIELYQENDIPMIFLTSVGQLIGMMNLQKAMGRVDLSIWVN